VGTEICAAALGWVVATDYGSVRDRVKEITSDMAIASVGWV
jgi:vacuolar-type H+-ATPase subunit I/STV1